MKGFLALAAALMAIAIAGCGDNKGNEDTAGNLFADATLRQISELRASRKAVDLSKYCSSQYPAYRKAALLSLASLRDSLAVYPAAGLLQDPDPEVREAAIFALGETGSQAAEQFLLEADFSHHPDDIKAAQMVALAKCGSQKALKYVEDAPVPHSSVVLVSAQCRALCILASKGIFSASASQKSIEYLCDTAIHESARALAAEYFAICSSDFSLYTDELAGALRRSSLVGAKASLLLALGKCRNQRALSTIKEVAENPDSDIRLSLCAVRAMGGFPYYDCKDNMLALLASPNDNIAAAAAGFLLASGIKSDSLLYWNLAQSKIGWRPRTLLLSAALKFSSSKSTISDGIRQGFGITPNIHEKAALLSALRYDLDCIQFVEDVAMYAESPLVRAEGVKTLVAMYESDEFPGYARSARREQGRILEKEFALMFKNLIANGNAQMASLAASFLTRHPELNEYLSNSYFINQAIAKYSSPCDAETVRYLRAALKSVAGADLPLPVPEADTIAWDMVSRLKPHEDVEVATSRGKFTIRANAGSTPVAVSKFLSLVDSKYFDGTCFYCGDPAAVRNRGSLSPFYEGKAVPTPPELSAAAVEEGTVVLEPSPAGDSYPTKWTVVLYPSALIDGNVTVIGKVVEGMDVVLSLNTCDLISSMKRK